MKYTKTTLRELSHKYATVLKKCALLNMGILLVSTSVSASTSIPSTPSAISIDGTTVSGTYADQITNDNGQLSLTDENLLGFTGDITVQKADLTIKDSELTAGGKHNVTFKNATVAITESDLETNGDITITNANLKVSCIDCYSVEEGEEDFSHMVMGENVTIKNSNIILGDTSRLSETQKDYAYLGGNADFIIGDNEKDTIDTTVTLNGHSVLAYEGTIADNGSGSVQIYNTHLTLNNNSSLLLGTPPDDADETESEQESGNAGIQTLSSTSDETTPTVSAPLTIKNSIIDLNGDSKVEFLVSNADNTTISKTTINMNQQDDSTASASMTLNDVTIENNSVINMASGSSITAKNVTLDGSSIHMKDNSILNVYDVIYKDGLISVDGDNAKIMLNKKTDVADGESTVNTLTLQGTLPGGTTINTSILSDDVGNIVNFLGNVTFAGLFDPATANVGDGTTETVLTKNAYDDAITYNLNAKGTLKYTDDKYLYDDTKHTGTYAKNSVVFKGGTLDLRNNTATAIKLASMALESDSNIFVDADLANKTMDTVSADNVTGNAKLNVAGINLLSDATENKTTINFADDTLKGQVAYTGEQELTALSPVYKYTVAYDDQTGDFEFTRQGGTGQSSAAYNPAVYSTSTVGQSIGLLQSAISGVAFNEMGGSGIGRSGGDTPTMANAWVKMVGFDDNVDFDSFQTVEADTTSVLAGVNTAVIKAGSIDTQYGLYAGYLNGKQEYEGNEIDQDGGYIGLTSSVQKGNLFAQGTLNGGFVHNKASHSFGADKYNSFFSGVGLKTGYNWTIGGAQITPSIYGGYTFVRTEDYTSKSGAKIENDHLKVWELTPALKVSKDFNDGWNGFAQVKYTFVGDNKADVSANDIVLPNISLKDYVEYGIGASRGLSDDWTASFTLNRRDGGRQGWNGSVSLEYNF